MDRDLVERTQRGDREAFALLARARADWMFAIAYRMLRDFHRAEDAVQQALVIAWQELPVLRNPDRFEPWLRRLPVRICYPEARRARHWASNIHVVTLAKEPANRDDTLSVADRDQLERGFRRLPSDQRAILMLHHYEGLDSAEIAETLGLPAGTVRLACTAHRAMRAALEAVERRVAAGGRLQ
jgi:RNA polymerase sigma-70 factor, ECF subfamily